MFALEYELAKTIQLQSKQCCSLLCKKQKSKNQVIKHLSIETGNKNTLKNKEKYIGDPYKVKYRFAQHNGSRKACWGTNTG